MPKTFDIAAPNHAAAYLLAAHTFLTEWPPSWDAEELYDALNSEEEDEILDNVVVWDAVETWVDETDDHDFLKAHRLIESLAVDFLDFAARAPLKVFLVSIDIRWGEQVTTRKHVVQATEAMAANRAVLAIEASHVGCEYDQLEADTNGWYSHTNEHFFYAPEAVEVPPADAAALLRYLP